MPDRFLHTTWTIRTISPFAVPISNSIKALEESLTRHLRSVASSEEEWACGGTYVSASCIELHSRTNNHKRKRPSSRHFHLDIYEQDAPTAKIILCFANHNNHTDENAATVNSFSFLLSRGNCDTIFQWFESNCACIVGLQPYCPTPTNVVSALTTWTKLMDHDSDTSNKPLHLSFAVPQNKNLNKISFSIPPLSLTRLCRKLEPKSKKVKGSNDSTGETSDNEGETAEQVRKDSSGEKGSCGDDSSSAAVAKAQQQSSDAASLIDDDENKENELTSSSLLKAIYQFAWEAFHMNIESFPLIRASSAVAVLACDGRCRFLDEAHLDFLLEELSSMISNQVLSTTTQAENTQRENDTVPRN